jgi:serine/threonine protein kinase
VTDFGLVKKLVEEGQMTSTFCGTPEYLAPEMVRKVPYTKSVDWWAFGSILYEMLVGVQPFYHQNQKRMFHAILNDPVVFSPKVSQNARDLIGKLLEKNPDRRLGSGPADFMEIQGHPFFASLDWNAVMNKWIIPEWKPIIKGDTDVSNFKQSSTATEKGQDWEQVDLIRDPSAQRAFAGFTFVNESRL